jgi:YHS domain-containing protein
MKYILSVTVILLSGLMLYTSCDTTGDKKQYQFSEQALAGKTVFQNKGCANCHKMDDPANTLAPLLNHPLIAGDTVFVQAHLELTELSMMPPVDLTQKEIQAVSNYIAELHRASQPLADLKNADTKCPVCSAPVSKVEAGAKKLTLTFGDETYYFECGECLTTFESVPETFVELLRGNKSITSGK